MCACMSACKNVCACKQACEGLSFYSAGTGVQIQVVRFGNKHFSPSEPSQQSRCEVFFFFFLLMLPLWFRSALCFSIQNESIARIASLPVRIATRFSS